MASERFSYTLSFLPGSRQTRVQISQRSDTARLARADIVTRLDTGVAIVEKAGGKIMKSSTTATRVMVSFGAGSLG